MKKGGLQATGLRVELSDGTPVVDDLSLAVAPGEILAVVGESGSGKTTAALALLGYTKPGLRLTGGEVTVGGKAISHDEHAARAVRGRLISYVPQDSGNSLNPAMRIGSALRDMIRAHAGGRSGMSAEGALESVLLPGSKEFMHRFPHQLSGGQQQRVTIAVALVCEPPVVVLDEPTTGLDVVTQAAVLREVARLRRELGIAMVYVSHDLAVVAHIADRIAVMYAGRVVELGPASDVLSRPRHPYTRGLMMAIPDHARPRRVRGIPGVAVGVGERGPGCGFAPRCEMRIDRCVQAPPPTVVVGDGHESACLRWQSTPPLAIEPFLPPDPLVQRSGPLLLDVAALHAEHRSALGRVVVARDISFSIAAGEPVALVGESGSGKTTIARCIVGLHTPASGTIALDGETLSGSARNRTRDARRRIQIIFQNPYDSLNPRHRVEDSLSWTARQLRGLSRTDATAEVARLLELVRLSKRLASRFPSELSGGERQRVAIARALAAAPDLLVCDEVTSALDVSVQAAILELLASLRREIGVAMLFISHNLGVVAVVAERVLVLEGGAIVEEGPVGVVLQTPAHAYTSRLVESAPRLPDGELTISA